MNKNKMDEIYSFLGMVGDWYMNWAGMIQDRVCWGGTEPPSFVII
jgi:hypothetical protein